MAVTGSKTRGGKRTYHHGDLRAALVAAALALIEQHGVKGFSLKDAAVMAGVSTAAPYRHFADKDALLRAIQLEGFAMFNAALAAAYEQGETPAARIEELGVAYVLFALQHPAHFRVMFGQGGTDKAEPAAEQQEEPTGFLLLVRGVAALTPRATAKRRNDLVLACWSLVHGFAMLQIEGAFAEMGGIGDVERQLRRTLRRTLERTPRA